MVSRRTVLGALAACALAGCDGRLRADDAGACERAGDEMPRWVAYAGRIMIADNSIGVGYLGLVGGFRPGLSAALTARGVGHVYVGPHSDAYGSHRSVSGVTASGQAAGLEADCATYRPRIVVVGYPENDIGTAWTAAETIESVRLCVQAVQSGAPQALVIVRSAIVPQTADIPAYHARRDLFAEYNGLGAAMCAAEGARWVDIGAPTTSDGLHPDDTSTGYPSIATTLAAEVVASLPGGPLSA